MTATLRRLLAAAIVATGLVGLVFVGQGGADRASTDPAAIDIDICISINLPDILGGKPSCKGQDEPDDLHD